MSEAWTKPTTIEVLDYGQRPKRHGWVQSRSEVTREDCGGEFNCEDCASESRELEEQRKAIANLIRDQNERDSKRPKRIKPCWIWLRDRIKEIENSKKDFAFKGKIHPPEYDEELDSIKPILEDVQRILREKNKKERERIRLRSKLRE